MLFSVLCLRSRILGKSSALEKASVIILMAVSTSSFVHSEFHDRTWWRLCYFALLGTSATKILSLFLDCRTETFFNFAAACVGYGTITMFPVAHAKLSPLANHTALAPTFIKLVAMNTCGALIYVFQVPERLGNPVSSKLLLHCIVVYSATLLSDELLTSYTNEHV
jgi:predicted membrane channel-forming protein YqfA (hemolysin III family)